MLEDFQRYWNGNHSEPRLLILRHEPERSRRQRFAAVGTAVYHVAIILFALNAPAGGGWSFEGTDVRVDLRRATPLVAPRNLPPFKVTQKEAQRGKPAAEVDLAALMPQPEIRQSQQTPAGRPFTPPPGVNSPSPRPAVIEAPPVELAQQGLPNLPNGPSTRLPGAPPADAPKLANPFERVGGTQPGAAPAGQARIAPPKQSVDEAVRSVVKSGGRGLVVGDTGAMGSGGISEAISQDPSARRNASTLELLSDPQGVDFRPYLIQVLAAVKRNWQAVTPESARLGLQGRTAIMFSISKSGGVPKLVISMPSGREALDRAAVAGISASNPFPPLPAEFKGMEIRLQLVFSYNMPR
ncbi:MAG: TonB family protein [Acidobacteria bacterium]|nr:TonB family protein [Acidobacteriota bacterium]